MMMIETYKEALTNILRKAQGVKPFRDDLPNIDISAELAWLRNHCDEQLNRIEAMQRKIGVFAHANFMYLKRAEELENEVLQLRAHHPVGIVPIEGAQETASSADWVPAESFDSDIAASLRHIAGALELIRKVLEGE